MGGGVAMGGGGLIWFLVFGALIVIPFWRLLPQYRIPSWVALVAVIPLGALILLWVMAFRDKLEGGA
ncbi:hypothetical protein ACQ5SP_04405 [Rhodovulum sp. YNF3179]|uniref:hypothetical protein n=1 Tax=Rhodovulum sp. YNF3179 TaxID=3425127 RepID=UPI003D33C9E1